MKKLLSAFIVGLLMSTTAVLGYATISYVLNKIVDQSVTVGNTVKYTDGLIIELINYDPYTLTYFELDETESTKHYVTYTYSYQILVENMNMEVSSLSNDIVVSEFVVTESTIAITFSLNQEKVFTEGDIINIEFYFEGVEPSLGSFTPSNPININTATAEQLYEIGLTDIEVQRTIDMKALYTYNNLNEWAIYIEVSGFVARYQEYVDSGIIVFSDID